MDPSDVQEDDVRALPDAAEQPEPGVLERLPDRDLALLLPRAETTQVPQVSERAGDNQMKTAHRN